MRLSCNQCSNEYVISDRLIYDLRFLAETKGDIPKCKVCKMPIELKSLPELFQGEEKTLLRGERLNADVVRNLKKLYPMPHVTYKARKIIKSSRAGFEEIGGILKADPALAGRVLKVANSAYYGMSGKISSIHHAATLLGSDTLIQIITLVGNSKMLGTSLQGYNISSDDLWKHSLTAAVCANVLSVKRSSDDEEDSFLAGLMHDSGKIILDSYVLQREKIFHRYLEVAKVSIQKAEQVILGFDHAHTGYELCLKWNLPENLSIGIKYHHNPFVSGGNKLAYILYIADYMAKMPNQEDDAERSSINRALQFLGFSGNELGALLEEGVNAVEALEEDTY